MFDSRQGREMQFTFPDGNVLAFELEQLREVDCFPVLPLDHEVVRYQGDAYLWLGIGWERLTEDGEPLKLGA